MGGFGGVWVAGGLGYEGGLGPVGCLRFLDRDRGEEKGKESCCQMFSFLPFQTNYILTFVLFQQKR